jgi:hypothetical protein
MFIKVLMIGKPLVPLIRYFFFNIFTFTNIIIKGHLIYELVDGPLPLEKDLVEAAERAGIRHVASI